MPRNVTFLGFSLISALLFSVYWFIANFPKRPWYNLQVFHLFYLKLIGYLGNHSNLGWNLSLVSIFNVDQLGLNRYRLMMLSAYLMFIRNIVTSCSSMAMRCIPLACIWQCYPLIGDMQQSKRCHLLCCALDQSKDSNAKHKKMMGSKGEAYAVKGLTAGAGKAFLSGKRLQTRPQLSKP